MTSCQLLMMMYFFRSIFLSLTTPLKTLVVRRSPAFIIFVSKNLLHQLKGTTTIEAQSGKLINGTKKTPINEVYLNKSN